MSVRRFIALLCLIAGSFGSGPVAALDCTITIGRSCQGVDNRFFIDAKFPLDNRSRLVIANRGAAECRLDAGSRDVARQGEVKIPGRGEEIFYYPGYYRLSSGSLCDLSIRGEQDLSPAFDVVCPPTGSYSNDQTVGDGWRISIQSGRAVNVPRWNRLMSRPGPWPQTTEISCQYLGQNAVYATKVIPGDFLCAGTGQEGTCMRQ